MPKRPSAGLLLYRRKGDAIEVFLVHPGGPFWAKKDAGAWSLPKGEFEEGEDARTAALREFGEETGFAVDGELLPLPSLRQPGGKIIHAWAVEGDCDPAALRSNLFSMEWPPRSGLMREFPEVDRGQWFSIEEARVRLSRGQVPFLDALTRV